LPFKGEGGGVKYGIKLTEKEEEKLTT